MKTGLALAANTLISALSTVVVTDLLKSPKLPSLIALNSQRLSQHYDLLTSFLRRNKIQYIPGNAGPYVLVKLVPDAESWDDEADMVNRLKRQGLLVSAGRAYHGPEQERGWARVSFSIPRQDLERALEVLESDLCSAQRLENRKLDEFYPGPTARIQ